MSKQKLQTLKGFRDFLPKQKRQRDYVQSKIVEIFERFGFEPVETPTLEYASLLLGKYGDEADKLVYSFKDRGDRVVALRYDQTVPSARVLAQYQNELPKFFRRFQIQNVFRADKPQKGRYREFRQCDIDIFGSTSPLADAEILACAYFAYKNVGFSQVKLYVNDRQTLMDALTPFATPEVEVYSIIGSIDKLDKQSKQEVIAELVAKGMSADSAKAALEKVEKSSMSSNLSKIVDMALSLGVDSDAIVFNPKLARGLDYYTGLIFEVIIPEYGVGSCGGGGRYDNLIGDLSGQEMPAVGMAFGFDRTVEAAQALELIPESDQSCQLLLAIFDDEGQNKTLPATLKVANKLRRSGISLEVYPGKDKLGKQFKYADGKNIPFVGIIGQQEMENNLITIKDMGSGEQKSVTVEEAVQIVRDRNS